MVPWQGKLVQTAIWKSPVSGRVKVGKLNVAGDRQADLQAHGGEQRAVMVYQLESYRHWSKFLNRSDLEPGRFGENFTVAGLADDEVCVGDRFRIGSAVFEVSQPKVTCYKLGLKLDCPQMPSLVVTHGRPGFYFRVIEEGEVGAGDAIEKIAAGPEGLTISQIDGLLYGPDHALDDVRRALRIPALSPGWQWSMREMLKAAEDGRTNGNAGLSGAVPPVAWQGFRRLRVTVMRAEGEGVKWIELASADGQALPKRRAGQHIVLKLPVSDTDLVTRIYSLCGDLDAPGFEIAVKADGGAGSQYIHDRLAVGDDLEVSAPRGDFLLRGGSNPVVLLSAGIGVTPILSMLRALSADGSARQVWWLHSAHDKRHHSFAGIVPDLLRKIGSARSAIFYSSPGDGERQGIDFDFRGRMGLEAMEALQLPLDADYYLCGPAGYLASVTANLRQLGVATCQIHSEAFGVDAAAAGTAMAPHPPEGEPGNGPLVTFLRSGITTRWDDRYGNLLALAEACNVPVRWSCRTGVCRNCESGLIEGEVSYSPDPIDAPSEGRILLCCSSPLSCLQVDL
jgi:MOSC domain-containing protein YiiM/ferredoxin-NADP reductase